MSEQPTGTVTFLFTDIEGSTKLARQFPETWESSRSRHHQILREAIETNNGFVFQVIGDEFCAAFYRAGDALQAAVKAQQGLQTEPWGECVIRVRMGIHTGEAEASDNEYKGYLTLSLVQRLMSAAHGKQILISNVTENLLRNQLPKDVSLRDMGERRFKDVPYPVRIFQVHAPGLQEEFPALRVLDEFPNNLPTQLTSFIGREKEVADVKRLLANTRLLTLIGPGGTGKTRLSLQVGMDVLHSYSDGVWFLELAPVSDPSLVPAAALAALDLPAEVHRPAIEMLCDYLREKEPLLILDNCEHLVDACARMVDRLLHAAPKLRILASSREALGIAGEVSYRVPSLEVPDINQLPSLESLSQYEAVRLFIERAVAALPTFAVTNQNAPAVAQICHRLDGIPLALELAAAKVRALSVEQISKRLDDRFRLLTGGSRTALERHQTLRATLDWSHHLLPQNEQVLFRRLSVFVNGWTLEAAESVCSDETIHSEDVFELLEQLVNKSLVIAEEWQSETRYRMLETMRQYANEKLIEAGESETLRDRHLDYFLSLAETAEPYLIRPEQLEWLDRLEAEHENMRVALERSLGYDQPEHALRFTAALGRFWQLHCYWMEGARWLERALVRPAGNETSTERTARVRALVQEVILAQDLDQWEKMKASAETSLALSEAGTNRYDLAIAQYYMGYTLIRFDDFQAAHFFLEKSLSAFRTLKDPYWEAVTHFEMLWVLSANGEEAFSEKLFPELERARKVGERFHLADVLQHRANLAWDEHKIEEAEAYLRESEILYEEIGNRAYASFLLRGWIALLRNDFEQARAVFVKIRDQSNLLGEKNNKSFAIRNLGILAREEGYFDQAQSYFEEALTIQREVGFEGAIGTTLMLLGHIDFLRGQPQAAKHKFIEGLFVIKTVNNFYMKSGALCHFAHGCADIEPIIAMEVVGALHAIYRNKLHQSVDPLLTRDLEGAITKARQHLNESALEAAHAEGEKMTIEEVIDLALKTLDEL